MNVRTQLLVLSFCLPLLASAAVAQAQQSRPTSLAVLDFGKDPTGLRAAAVIRETLHSKEEPREFTVIDRDQAGAAGLGAGFAGLLNLTIQQARDIGSAMGCDFYLLGEAQTLRRSPSIEPVYYESYATVFLVSARTGKLVLWERPAVQRAAPVEAEKALLAILSSDETRQRYLMTIRRAQEDERAARVIAVEGGAQIIEVMTDDDSDQNQEVRAPRPYRRLKPPYPETAARAEVEATVDVLVDIDARGEVGRVEIIRWAGYGLDQSVIDTVKQMHFFPAQRDGVAIPMRVLLRYKFRKPPVQNRSQ
ncbi:MAG TPA: energy transducer TonB [Pyrinomonadaceae bacterium]|nr:energy transducer TonB [Pyrinomonadaceae bacterium]